MLFNRSKLPPLEQMTLFRDTLTPAERKKLNRDIFRISMPVFIGGGINAFVGLTTRVFISDLGELAYNSINLCMTVFFMIILVLVAISVGTTTLIAQNWGKGQKERAGEIVNQSLILCLLLGIFIALVGFVTRDVFFRLMGMDTEMAEVGEQFLNWLYLGLPVITPGFFLAAALRGAGDTRTPMKAGLVMSGVSLVLSYGLILGNLGMPRLEGMGAALAINGSFLAYTLFQAFAVFSNRTVLKVSLKKWHLDYRTTLSILKIGLPSAGEWTLIRFGFMFYIMVVTYYGSEVLAGFFIGIAIFTLTQSLTQGIQVAATTMVGQAVGSRNFARAESIFRQTTLIGSAIMAFCGIIWALGANKTVLLFFFNELSPASIDYARDYILILCLVMPLMGASFAIAGGLRGAGATVGPLAAAAVGVYGRIAFAFIIYYLIHPSIYVIWCAMFPDLIIRILMMGIQLKSGGWKTAKVRL